MPPSFPALAAACFLAPLSSGFLPALRGSVLKVLKWSLASPWLPALACCRDDSNQAVRRGLREAPLTGEMDAAQREKERKQITFKETKEKGTIIFQTEFLTESSWIPLAPRSTQTWD